MGFQDLQHGGGTDRLQVITDTDRLLEAEIDTEVARRLAQEILSDVGLVRAAALYQFDEFMGNSDHFPPDTIAQQNPVIFSAGEPGLVPSCGS